MDLLSKSIENMLHISELAFLNYYINRENTRVWMVTTWKNKNICLIYRVEIINSYIYFSLFSTFLFLIYETTIELQVRFIILLYGYIFETNTIWIQCDNLCISGIDKGPITTCK